MKKVAVLFVVCIAVIGVLAYLSGTWTDAREYVPLEFDASKRVELL